MKPFIDRLIEQIKRKRSHIVVGLDPDYNRFPEVLKSSDRSLKEVSKAIEEFNCRIIDAIYDLVPAIKPQIVFYERYGIEGLKSFANTVNYGKEKGLIVIEDAKKNDIGSTATAYSDGHIGRVNVLGEDKPVFDVDAITVNPYLGSDGIIPFTRDVQAYGKGIFVLVKTSNSSSVEIQDVKVTEGNGECKLYEIIAKLTDTWGSTSVGNYGYSSVGAVVGATFPKESVFLRRLMPKTYFLVPGYGAQGGTASDIVNCFNKDGYGAIISASRSINYAFEKNSRFTDREYAQAAREAVIKMNSDINRELKKAGIVSW